MTALCVLLLYGTAYLPTGRLGIFVLSSLVIAGAVIELGVRWGTVVYIASAVLTFLLTGSINTFLLFLVFFGSYPLIKYHIEKRNRVVPSEVLKLAAINLLAAAGYYTFKALTGISAITLPSLSPWLIAGIIVAAQFAFLLYDYVLSRLIVYYMDRIRFIKS